MIADGLSYKKQGYLKPNVLFMEEKTLYLTIYSNGEKTTEHNNIG